MVTSSAAMATLTSGMSTSLFDMSLYKKGIFQVVASKPYDATTFSGNITVTVYESTASTWNGAVATAITATVKTATINSSTLGHAVVEMNDYDMSCNSAHQWVGAYVSAWTSTDFSIVVERYRGDVEPLE